jgi:polyisoprenyl-teichoic acid--peptidoglycan teichoic acid transferase
LRDEAYDHGSGTLQGKLMRQRPRPQPPKRSRLWAWVALLLLAVTGFGAGLAFRVMGALGAPPQATLQILHNPGEQAFGAKSHLNILCLGVDYNHDSKGMLYTKFARTDTIFVVSIDRSARSLNVLSVPRDTWVDVPNHGFDKINAAYSLTAAGDLKRTVACVQNLLGVPIDHTIVIKPYAAERLVDAVGGVDLVIDRDMNYDDNWGDLHIHLKKGPAHLNGKQAVGFIRFRKDAEGDRGRMRRQQVFLHALVKQAARFDTLLHVQGIAQAVRQNVKSSLDMAQLIDLGMLYRHFDRKQMKMARLDGEDAICEGVCCIKPDPQAATALARSLLTEPTTAAQSPTSQPAAGTAKLEILNGSGKEGAAGRLRESLQSQGWTVVSIGDADALSTTEVRAHCHLSTAQLPSVLASAKLVEAPDPSSQADVTVILGEDWTL